LVAPNADVEFANVEPLMWNVLLVEPWTPGHVPVASVNQPAPVFGGACVSRPFVRRVRAVLQHVAETGHQALVRILGDRVLAQAVGREEQELAVTAPVPLPSPLAGRRGQRHERRRDRDRRERTHQSSSSPSAPGSHRHVLVHAPPPVTCLWFRGTLIDAP
jgi:hypothetical protein